MPSPHERPSLSPYHATFILVSPVLALPSSPPTPIRQRISSTLIHQRPTCALIHQRPSGTFIRQHPLNTRGRHRPSCTLSLGTNQNFTSTHPPPASSLAALSKIYTSTNAAPHAGACAHALARVSADTLLAARETLAAFTNAPSPPQTSLLPPPPNIILFKNAHAAYVTLSTALRLSPDEALLFPGLPPAAYAAFPSTRPLPSTTLDALVPSFHSTTRAIFLPLVDAASGRLLDVSAILAYVAASGAEPAVIIDASAGLGRVGVDLAALGATFVVADGSGVRAPGGAFVAAADGALDALAPVDGGDDVFIDVTLDVVTALAGATAAPRGAVAKAAPRKRSRLARKARVPGRRARGMGKRETWAPAPGRIEVGMPDLGGAAALAAAVREIADGRGKLREAVREEDARLAGVVVRAIAKVPGVRVIGEGEEGDRVGRVGLLFGGRERDVLKGLRARGIGVESFLHGEGIAIRMVVFAGVHCDEDVLKAVEVLREVCVEVGVGSRVPSS